MVRDRVPIGDGTVPAHELVACIVKNIIPAAHHALEVDALPGVLLCHALETVDDSVLAVGYLRIVLDIDLPDVPAYGFSRCALVEHHVVERCNVLFVALALIIDRNSPLPVDESTDDHRAIQDDPAHTRQVDVLVALAQAVPEPEDG